ncbi:MAG: Hsp20/alpha crystallin family protein [Candidatus Omnitrophica bacterium]|nr:Hsp20/alpha crystallin family protein [Candidatus Omnitrophota bacterium]
MNLIRFNKNQNDPINELMNWDQPLFGLSLVPCLDKTAASWRDNTFLAVDVHENEKEVTVKADLPGLKKEDIHVSIDNDVLTIRGERKVEVEKKDKNYSIVERSYGTFERRLILGSPVDEKNVKASYKDGVLELTLPKTEASKPKRIEISE